MKRNRTSELVAPLQYWYQLNQVYEEWYEGYKDSKKICINVDTIDFVRQEDEEDYILDCILEALN
jgi:deoxyadenosine/deoxycytidine kinase